MAAEAAEVAADSDEPEGEARAWEETEDEDGPRPGWVGGRRLGHRRTVKATSLALRRTAVTSASGVSPSALSSFTARSSSPGRSMSVRAARPSGESSRMTGAVSPGARLTTMPSSPPFFLRILTLKVTEVMAEGKRGRGSSPVHTLSLSRTHSLSLSTSSR